MATKKSGRGQPNLRLRQAREARGWTQQELAEQVEAPYPFMINRWENGVVAPSPVYRARLAELFGQTAEELGLLPSQKISSISPTEFYDPAIPLPFANEQELIGRGELLAKVQQQLCVPQGRVRVALSGLPGVGKTTLAVALANNPAIREYFHDGILWIGLGPQPNLLALLSRWGGLLEINQHEAEALKDERSWLEWLHRAISTRQMLLIIDDAWSIEDALTCLVGGPNCSYLLTTRLLNVALQFSGSHLVQVSELNQDESMQLLIQLAPSVTQAEAEPVQNLVRATGGLPLALTLLGQHLLVQTGQQSGRRLQTTLDRLQSFEARVRLQRPQAGLLRDFRLPDQSTLSLQAVIGLSEAGLAQETRQMLSALAVFPAKPNSFPEEAALAVAEGAVEDLDSLVDASLVEYIGEGRYTLHQTIADYARAQSPNGPAEQRMARYYCDFLTSQRGNYTLLEPETANSIQALQFAIKHDLRERFIQGVLAFIPFLQNRALHQLVRQYLEQAEQFARASEQPATLVAVLQMCGNVASWGGHYEQAEAIYQEGLQLAVQREDSRQICQFFLLLGRIARRRGEYRQAEHSFQEGLFLARQLAEHECACNLLHALGALAAERAEYAQADLFFSESLILARLAESEKLICKSLNNLAALAAEQAQFTRAEHYWRELLLIVRRIQWNEQLSVTLANLGTLMRDQGNFAQAEMYYEECLALDRQLANRERLGQTLVDFSTLLRMQAAYDRAWTYLQEGLELARQIGHRRLLSKFWLEIGELHLQTGQCAEAERAFGETLRHLPDGQHSLNIGAHYGLARTAALRGNREEARRLGEQCLASFATSGHLRLEEVRAWLANI